MAIKNQKKRLLSLAVCGALILALVPLVWHLAFLMQPTVDDIPQRPDYLKKPLDLTQLDAPQPTKAWLNELQSLVSHYNENANGIELSEHGVKGNLPKSVAAGMAENANSLLTEINDRFDQPVAKLIGSTWYQAPSRFRIDFRSVRDAGDPNNNKLIFTISHDDCGRYEYDFEIQDEGLARVTDERYDSYGIGW